MGCTRDQRGYDRTWGVNKDKNTLQEENGRVALCIYEGMRNICSGVF